MRGESRASVPNVLALVVGGRTLLMPDMSVTEPQKRPLIVRLFLSVVYWAWWLFVYIAVVLVVGSAIGALLFATVGALTHPQVDVMRRIEVGLQDGFLYAGLWAGGLAIVLCVMRAYRQREQRHAPQDAEAVPSQPSPQKPPPPESQKPSPPESCSEINPQGRG